ncbi:MAG: 4-alpha-glucanotransferase [Candidatus Kerfeldbacteria bacterium]|nr:4-alpha-glucanotransferase [Candidatus Kerfeldbacteria bacterium]
MKRRAKPRLKGRPAGIFCPVSALPSRFGIGDFGPGAYRWLDWLAAAGQQYWQVLPLTIVDAAGSPYMSSSSRAGNWLLLSPERLVDAGWLEPADVGGRPEPAATIGYRRAARIKRRILGRAYRRFLRTADRRSLQRWQAFVARQQSWLEPFALYAALKDHWRHQPWWRWPAAYQTWSSTRRQVPPSVVRGQRFHTFLQWLFDEQWTALRSAAHDRGIRIIGDLPFFTPLDSVEVWQDRSLFQLTRTGRPQAVAGVPPDPFNPQGQRWGMPVYRWSKHRRHRFQWWQERLQAALGRYDLVRFDHFHGYVSTWHIPARHLRARRGHWVATPGREILQTLRQSSWRKRILVEDLGHYSPRAEQLRRGFHLPGTRVLIFGWSGLRDNIHSLPHIGPDVFCYTSTHDTNTVNGWWQQEARWYERRQVARLFLATSQLHWRFITAVYRSGARVAMVPVQDVLGLGSEGRLNKPGTKRRNWRWRLRPGLLTSRLARRLRHLTEANYDT